MKRIVALLLGLLMVFTFVLAEESPETPAEAETIPAETETTPTEAETIPGEKENYMIPRQFMSMFDAVFELYANQYYSDKAEYLIGTYSLSTYDFQGVRMYYCSPDWRIETGFEFESEEAVSPDAESISWYLFISDYADEEAWYLTMYCLKQMITYTHEDMADDIMHYFQTVEPEDILELPDGYSLVTYRTENDDGIMFELYPSSNPVPAADEG